MDPISEKLSAYYSAALQEFGPTSRGMDWSNEAEHNVRLNLMLRVAHCFTETRPASVLDVGCGVGFLADRIDELCHDVDKMTYYGIDVSEPMIEAAKRRRPDREFLCQDILSMSTDLFSFDFVLMNGVLTERLDVDFQDMEIYARALLARAYAISNNAIAFNVMRPFGTEKVAKFFHWSFDDCLRFVTDKLSKHFIVNASYGIEQEYTVFVFKKPPNILTTS